MKADVDCFEFPLNLRLLLKPGPRPWTRTLKNLISEKPRPRKTWILKNLDPEKPGLRKTWILKNLDHENPGL